MHNDDDNNMPDDEMPASAPAISYEMTEKSLMRLSREQLDDIAIDFELEPEDYPNKGAVVAAVLAAHVGDDGQRLAAKGRLEHTGKWIVQTPVRYLSTSGKPTTASMFVLDENGQALLDEHTGQPVQNIIDDIPFEAANDLYRRGALAPHMA